MPCLHAKIRLKSATQKPNLQWQKLYQQVIHQIVAANTLARCRIVRNGNATLLLIKTILCETNNILFSKNYQKLGRIDALF